MGIAAASAASGLSDYATSRERDDSDPITCSSHRGTGRVFIIRRGHDFFLSDTTIETVGGNDSSSLCFFLSSATLLIDLVCSGFESVINRT